MFDRLDSRELERTRSDLFEWRWPKPKWSWYLVVIEKKEHNTLILGPNDINILSQGCEW